MTKTSHKFRLIDWARDQRTGSEGADTLLWRMAALCNVTHKCTMSDRGMGDRFGMSERTVSRRLRHLRDASRIRLHYEKGRRVITFNLPTGRQDGGPPPPRWRAARRQNGGQNSYKGIHTDAERTEYARIASMDNPTERNEAFIAFRKRKESG